MKGKHARPSAPEQAAMKAVPAVAAVGALLTTVHPKPEPPRPVVAELDSSVTAAGGTPASDSSTAHTAKPAPENQVYVVQAGDSLSTIAQRYYGDSALWPQIFYANQAVIHDPDVIVPGEQLVIPHTSGHSSPSVTPDAIHPVQLPGVPSAAAGYIVQAADATGLPVAVVAAQNYVESHYGTDDGPSTAGAMGPWQFIPSTWVLYSPAPFSEATSWAVSTPAYIAYMKVLLHWSGGNVRMALAAYNAGQGNWQAGLGYADTILGIAGS